MSKLTWPFANLDGVWSHIEASDESLVLPRVGHAAVSMGDWVLLLGGVQPDQASREREVSCIDARTATWHRLQCFGNAPTGRAWHTATAVQGGRVLVFGGSNGRKLFGDLHELQLAETEGDEPPAGARWSHPTTTGETPPSRMGHTATCVPGGRLWMFGGFTKASANKGYACELYELDVSTMDWHRLEPRQDDDEPPIAGRLGAASFVHDETFLVFGGSISGKAVNELLALGTGARVTLARVQAKGQAAVTPRHSAAATLSACGRYAFVHGGCVCDKEEGINRVLGDMLQLSLDTYTWAVLKPSKGAVVPGLRFKHVLTTVGAPRASGGARLLLFGGSAAARAVPPTLLDGSTPCARLVPPKAQDAPTQPGAPPQQRGSLPWLQELA